ncbi:MAG: hypothetical protein CMN57_13090 [Gammaproteobacteria bacterium]|uniref:hypothetical protein n=1 Tax=Thiohalobacter sp. COW1 TaxID=2795687 RepID=UPI000C0A3523|nr:hypothetical protein [Thiohalobacter sp. COW1]MAT66562.1 hypothetical protein [Gammaproteobacteria bacterium]BCO30044.1 hypothetical protein TspCOW1_01470 [Thiohalobacter sp. COW1]
MNNKKQCVSVRFKPSDLERIERIARRLGARNSDVIRYAVKTALTRLMDLCDPRMGGQRLLPLLLGQYNELNRHFDLDADRLEGIINNEEIPEQNRVERTDIELLAMCALSPHYIQNRLQEITGQAIDADDAQRMLHKYLQEKYGQRQSDGDPSHNQSLQ